MAGSGVGAAADMEGRDRSGIFSGDIADVDILYKVATSGLHHAWWCSWETQTLPQRNQKEHIPKSGSFNKYSENE